jgi:hypothetical protein
MWILANLTLQFAILLKFMRFQIRYTYSLYMRGHPTLFSIVENGTTTKNNFDFNLLNNLLDKGLVIIEEKLKKKVFYNFFQSDSSVCCCEFWPLSETFL